MQVVNAQAHEIDALKAAGTHEYCSPRHRTHVGPSFHGIRWQPMNWRALSMSPYKAEVNVLARKGGQVYN